MVRIEFLRNKYSFIINYFVYFIRFDFMKYPSVILPEKCIKIDVEVNEKAEKSIFASGIEHGESSNQTHQTILQPYGSMQFDFSWFKFDFDFYLLDYEVDQFMLAYTCRYLFGKFAHLMVWIWSRNRELDNVYHERVANVLQKFNISLDPLEKSEQEHCN